MIHGFFFEEIVCRNCIFSMKISSITFQKYFWANPSRDLMLETKKIVQNFCLFHRLVRKYSDHAQIFLTLFNNFWTRSNFFDHAQKWYMYYLINFKFAYLNMVKNIDYKYRIFASSNARLLIRKSPRDFQTFLRPWASAKTRCRRCTAQ